MIGGTFTTSKKNYWRVYWVNEKPIYINTYQYNEYILINKIK